jgi:hypothetical protein
MSSLDGLATLGQRIGLPMTVSRGVRYGIGNPQRPNKKLKETNPLYNQSHSMRYKSDNQVLKNKCAVRVKALILEK